MEKQYTYAVSRIHAKESSMLSVHDMDRLLAASSFKEALNILAEKGYDIASNDTADEILFKERKKTYNLISELVDDMSVFDIFFYENDFQNLKASIKGVVTKDKTGNVFVGGGTVDSETIQKAVANREFDDLPDFLRDTAEKALQAILETADGGLCDVICDKAYLETLIRKSQMQDLDMIKRYAELTVALADIRIAVRGALLGKNKEFFRRSLAECSSILVSSLADSAAQGIEEVYSYLALTPYGDAVDVIKNSYIEFEKWCDNLIMSELKKERYNNFTVAPLAAFILAKETEIKMVGLILTAKMNELDSDSVKERLRELYV